MAICCMNEWGQPMPSPIACVSYCFPSLHFWNKKKIKNNEYFINTSINKNGYYVDKQEQYNTS